MTIQEPCGARKILLSTSVTARQTEKNEASIDSKLASSPQQEGQKIILNKVSFI